MPDISREHAATAQECAANPPFAMAPVRIPVFSDRAVSIAEHGAVGDGRTMNTEAFAKAIQACSKAGGGRVVVPPGVWLTGPIRLESRIDLHVRQGALVLFSRRFDDYPVIEGTGWGSRTRRCVSPISGVGLDGVAITGHGIIDGSGDAWRPVKKYKTTAHQWKALLDSGGALNPTGDIWYPTREAMEPGSRETLRPVLVSLIECRNALLDGPTFQNSPGWNLHPLMCEDLTIRNVTVLNPWYAQNGDGLDLDSCRRVVVRNCRFDVGDDAICLKSGADEAGRRRGRPCEDIVVSDCVVYHGHGGFTIGSEMSGGVRNVCVRGCQFLGTDLGLRFKSRRGRGGVVENIHISEVYMKSIATEAIGFNLHYDGGLAPADRAVSGSGKAASASGKGSARTAFPVNEGTPRFRDIHLRNIVCAGAKRAVLLEGLPEMPIEGVTLEDVTITAATGVEIANAKGIRISNASIIPQTGDAFRVRDSTDVVIETAAPAVSAPRN